MPRPDLGDMERELIACGISPKYVQRAMTELDEHFDDLVEERVAAGQDRGTAELDACAALGNSRYNKTYYECDEATGRAQGLGMALATRRQSGVSGSLPGRAAGRAANSWHSPCAIACEMGRLPDAGCARNGDHVPGSAANNHP